MTSTRATTTAALVAGLAAVSCVSSTATDVPRELPVGQQYSFTCGRWSPGSPAVDRALFDLRLWQDGIESGPAPAFVEAIEAAGGRIVYTFHGPMLRAELDPQAVPALASARVLNAANTVADSDVHDVTLVVLLSHNLSAEDLAAAQALGGRITHEYHALEGYAVVIDDARVPDLRALPGVKLAGFNAVFCLD